MLKQAGAIEVKAMDPELIRQLLAEDAAQRGGDPGILLNEVQRQEKFFEGLQCPYCGGSCRPMLVPDQLYKREGILPNAQAECNDCGTQFTPYTGIEIRGPIKDPLDPD